VCHFCYCACIPDGSNQNAHLDDVKRTTKCRWVHTACVAMHSLIHMTGTSTFTLRRTARSRSSWCDQPQPLHWLLLAPFHAIISGVSRGLDRPQWRSCKHDHNESDQNCQEVRSQTHCSRWPAQPRCRYWDSHTKALVQRCVLLPSPSASTLVPCPLHHLLNPRAVTEWRTKPWSLHSRARCVRSCQSCPTPVLP
jgi:hypothetical protein